MFSNKVLLSRFQRNLLYGPRRDKTCLQADSNQPAQLRRLARKIEISLEACLDMVLSNKLTTKALIRLEAFVVRNPVKTGLLVSRPILWY